MTAQFRLFGRGLGWPIRRLQQARLATPALAAVVLIVGAALVFQPPSGAPGPVAVGTAPEVSPPLPEVSPPPTACSFPEVSPPPTRTEADRCALAANLARNLAEDEQKAATGSSTPTPAADFWSLLYAFEATGPAYTSLADLGARSEAVVVGSFTGQVEAGREPCDEGALAAGASRELACVFFANLPFRIDEVVAGSLPERYRTTVKLEYMVRPSRQEALREVVPTDARVVLFIGSKYLRRAGIQDVYYALGIGQGTFRQVDGRVVPLGLPDDANLGRLEGMPFEQFINLVRRVPILDLMPEG